MKILVLICIIGFLILLFPEGILGFITNIFTVGGNLLFSVMPKMTNFLYEIFSSMFSTTYLYSVICIFLYINLIVWLIRFLQGLSKSYSDTDMPETETQEYLETGADGVSYDVTATYSNKRRFKKGKFYNEKKLVSKKRRVNLSKSNSSMLTGTVKDKYGLLKRGKFH